MTGPADPTRPSPDRPTAGGPPQTHIDHVIGGAPADGMRAAASTPIWSSTAAPSAWTSR